MNPYRGYDDRVSIETEPAGPDSDAMRFYLALPEVPPDAMGFDALAFLQAHGTRYRGVWSDDQISSLQTAIRHAQAMYFAPTVTTSIGGCAIGTNPLYEDLADVAREIARIVRMRDTLQAVPVPAPTIGADVTPQSHRPGGGGGDKEPLIPRPRVTPPGGGIAYADPDLSKPWHPDPRDISHANYKTDPVDF